MEMFSISLHYSMLCFGWKVMQMGAACKNCRQLPFFSEEEEVEGGEGS